MINKHWIALALFFLTLVCFGHVCLCEFIRLDDPLFVTQNPHVRGGLTSSNIEWAFSGTTYGGWVPLTWLSLQLDATLFGPDAAWGFHLTNLLMHAASVVLFFHLLERMTGELWPSAVCAALFAIHPLRVESVAWVSERRDVLSILLLMVTLAAYHYYTERPGWGRYSLVMLSFGLGLAAKQMLVTLPFALLLLDYWPLYRLRLGQAAPASVQTKPAVSLRLLILEKVPLLAMVVAVSLLTIRHLTETHQTFAETPWQDRLDVSLVGYMGYLEKTFWPVNLAALYPYLLPDRWSVRTAAGALLAITAVLIYVGRSQPMLLVGWLWFVGTLLPVSGVIRIGAHALADRYSYLPHMGLLITVVWGVGGLNVWQKANGFVRKAAVILVLITLGTLTWIQVWRWQNTVTLYKHTLSVTEDNVLFHAGLGDHLLLKGEFKEAEEHLARAIELSSQSSDFQTLFGAVMVQQEKYRKAIPPLRYSLHLQPNSADTHYYLAVALDRLGGRRQEARWHLMKSIEYLESPPTNVQFDLAALADRKANLHLMVCDMALRDGYPRQTLAQVELALAIKPDLVEGYKIKGIALGRLGRWAEAETALQNAATLPRNSATRGYLAFTYARQDKKELAAREYVDLLARFPDWPQTSNDFALKRVTKKAFLDPRLAEEVALQVCEATHYQDPRWLDTLAAAQAARFDFSGAQQTVAKALGLMPDPSLTHQLQERLRLYESNRALPLE